MVIYRGTDGKPAYHEVEEIHDAVQYVEQLRNDQGVEHATIHRMEQVNFEYRPYFRVELRSASGELLSGGPAPAAVPAAPATAVPDAAMAATIPTEAPVAAAPMQEAPAQVAASAPAEAPFVTEAPPASTEPSVSGAEADNGVGARRGLFGR